MTDIRPQGNTKMLVEMNIDQVSAYIQNGDIKDSAVYSKACVELGSAIDSAIGMDEVPSSSHLLKLLSVMKEVYIRKTDSLEPSLMLLMLPIKPQGSTKMLVEMNIDQVSAYIQNGDIKDSAVYSKACVELGSAIDSAIGMDEVPSSSHLLKLLSVMKEVYIRKTDSLEPSLMLLMLPIKAACKVGWFPDGDIKNELLLMAKEVSIGFSHTNKMIIEPSYAHSCISDIISRFYPRMNVEHILTSFDVKAGYGTFIADFHISQSMTLPSFENLDICRGQKVIMVKVTATSPSIFH
ncbi:zinc finger, MIZ-type, Zinc finger, RING/FYVE/PHD-type, E3 SUMO protein ligase [Artemisia annua]|uniref:Zinc finger, MIZ-type, Zinc finger, RING/FYVE/PHD-type, E3 SUMO protein ligase n=1 Tax=Artemisia annua TaxID=35608 RepID=A0A2U1LIL5_ARTAN|nr:zinc finger, MIZ-type, Zinc finger, RING/FYVE/PHD-type, E3 SUMO protein ligase [Artemisia annua]